MSYVLAFPEKAQENVADGRSDPVGFFGGWAKSEAVASFGRTDLFALFGRVD